MKKLSLLILLAMLLVQPGFILAHEGEDHGDMPKMETGMHEQMEAMHEENEATLKEAASILKATHPELAAKLEKMAEHHEDMKS